MGEGFGLAADGIACAVPSGDGGATLQPALLYGDGVGVLAARFQLDVLVGLVGVDGFIREDDLDEGFVSPDGLRG